MRRNDWFTRTPPPLLCLLYRDCNNKGTRDMTRSFLLNKMKDFLRKTNMCDPLKNIYIKEEQYQ